MTLSYEIVTHDRAGRERVHPYAGEDALAPGSVVLLGGRYWLVVQVEQQRVQARLAATAWRCTIPTGIGRPGRFDGSGPTRQAWATS